MAETAGVQLAEGKVFNSLADAKAYVVQYNASHFTNFVVNNNNKKSLVYNCRHAVQRKSSSGGKRPNQHYNYLGCSASIRMYKCKDGKVKITKLELNHTNHDIDENTHRFNNETLNEEEMDLVLTLKQANAKPSQIKRILCERGNKRMTTQRIRNLISKLMSAESLDTSLEEYLESMDSAGGTVKWTYDTDGCVDSLFISTAQMKKKFAEINPFSIQMDTTFNIEKGKYKLVAFCYLDVPSNKTDIAAFALIANEGDLNFNFILSELKALNVKNDYIFLVDKDFTSIDSIKLIFTEAIVLLCVFHVFKFMKNLISTALTTVEVKKEMFQKFKSLTKCPSESLYEDLKRDFLTSIENIQVRCNEVYVSLADYFKKNWESCANMWVKYHRNNLPLFGDHTTNRIERQFWSLKQSLSDTFGTMPKTSEAIIHLLNFTNDRLEERAIFNKTKRFVIFDADESTHGLNKEASRVLNDRGCILFHKSLKSLDSRRENLDVCDGGVKEMFKNNESKVYPATQVSCICTFHKEYRVPCHHILFTRENDASPLFDVETFDRRYQREVIDNDLPSLDEDLGNHDTPNEFLPEDEDNEVGDVISLTDHEKYKIIMPILSNIGNLVSCYSTNSFLQYVDEFKKIENIVRTGKCILRSDVSDGSSETLTEHRNGSSAVQDIDAPDTDTANNLITHVQTSDTDRSIPSTNMIDSENDLHPNPNAEPSSKYMLKFKKIAKNKGRPKKTSKQVVFNKTSLDKKENPKRKKKNSNSSKQKRRKVVDVLKDMGGENGEDEEEFSASELLDNERYEILMLPRDIDENEQINVNTDNCAQSFTYTDTFAQSFSCMMNMDNF